MATYTEHYGLHQWEAADDFLRTDFNADFAAIDGALGAKCEMTVGSYVGDGEESRTISLPFQPQAVLLTNSEGETYRFPETTGGLALAGHPLASYQYGDPCLAVAGSGFQVGQSDRYVNTNATGRAYHYAAFRLGEVKRKDRPEAALPFLLLGVLWSERPVDHLVRAVLAPSTLHSPEVSTSRAMMTPSSFWTIFTLA